MADYSEPSAVEIETATQETPSQRQARIRKEKREAKIRDGGNARLNKIIGLGGGLPRGGFAFSFPGESLFEWMGSVMLRARKSNELRV